MSGLSVIIPVHNGAHFLDRCLGSLGRSRFGDYECIVVDDASTDASGAVALRHGASVVTLVRNGGPARARNVGAQRAGGEILLFLDADVRVHPETLARVDAHFRAHPTAAAVIGSYDDAPTAPGFVSQYKNLFHHYVHQTSRADAWTFWGGCGAIRRTVFLAAGGFDEWYRRPCVEDIALGFRLRTLGHRIDLEPTIQVTHLKRWTFWSLLRTDVLDRGIPWFRLMLADRTMPADLNVTTTHRGSAALVCLTALLAGLVAMRAPLVSAGDPSLLPPLLLWTVFAAALLLVLNRDLYRFFARKRGLWFALRAVPMHWLYYGYCGVAVIAGLGLHLLDRLGARRERPRVTSAS
ncbi:MAG: glycosyltransferase family A protein [Candidatus Binatia bacterium]